LPKSTFAKSTFAKSAFAGSVLVGSEAACCAVAGCAVENAIAGMARAAKAAAQPKLRRITYELPYLDFTANTHSDPPAGTFASRSSPENSE
jgi:hypothetical protein